jgi:dienelactone hydrolase
MRLWLSFAILALSLSPAAAAEADALERGTVRFEPVGDQKEIPERYRLAAHSFDYEMTLKYHLPASGLTVYRVRFPSPVESPHKENNTVHAEFYRPDGKGPFPGLIILDITAGDQSLSRSMGTYFAQKGIAGLFVQMAYYGPRRPPGSRLRLLSTNVPQSLNAVCQTVLDLRRATAWLEARPEVDRKRLGIVGTSLGSMIGALAAEMEPKLRRVAVLLGGGGLVDAYYDHPQAAPYRTAFEKLGGTKQMVVKMLAPVDPLTCAANLKDRKVLIIAGKRDEIVLPKMSIALWEASGRQKIVWYDCTHYGAIAYVMPGLIQIANHFTAP